jgi:flagellar motor switch/type III secretory pathway protein FliN
LHGGDEPKLVVTEVERTPDLPAKKGTRRMEDTDTDTGTDRAVGVAGDAAVSVSVEIARFTMPLEELAALRAGEVVVTGRAIGEQVAIRAGERTIASGELVDVDGEVGVRILTLGE